MDFQTQERSNILFAVAPVPPLCPHYNSAVIVATDKIEVFYDNDGTRRWQGHQHYDGSWCSVHTLNNMVERESYATNLPRKFDGFDRHLTREVLSVHTAVCVYRVFADSAMLRVSNDGLVTDTYILHLSETMNPEIGVPWRPYVKGHAGNDRWAGFLNTPVVLTTEGDINLRSLLRR